MPVEISSVSTSISAGPTSRLQKAADTRLSRRGSVMSVPSTMVPIARWRRRGAGFLDVPIPTHPSTLSRRRLLRSAEKILFLGENPMSVEDAAATVFSAEHDAAVSLLHMRAQGVSFLLS